jgi:glycosyltransferase involved in cell wall biosynthesis
MQKALLDDYGVESVVQLPASDAQPARVAAGGAPGNLRIVFAGSLTSASIPGIDLLVNALRSEVLAGLRWSIDLYGATPQEVERHGWCDERIRSHGWTSQKVLHSALRTADVLYLPYPFDQALARFMRTSFPSKLADYLTAGKPLLICAPPDSTVMSYARMGGFAEVVDSLNQDLFAAALLRLATSVEHRQRLGARAVQVFAANHDIESQREDFRRAVAALAHQPEFHGEALN